VRARGGQVALYLVLVLVAITVLTLMNVGAYLAVSAKNKTMNAGDAAALAVAEYQGELLNRIGEANVAHLKAALAGDGEQCAEIFETQQRIAFLEPLEGLRIGNEAAKRNGAEKSDEMRRILAEHVADVRNVYRRNPDSYPEPWPGAWTEYAARLETALAGGLWAGPDNVDFVNAAEGHMLLNRYFYDAIAGRDWCWFKWNARGLLDSYSGFGSWAPLPVRTAAERLARAANCEVYSLHLVVREGSARALLGDRLIAQLTGATADEIVHSPLLSDPQQRWFFFDTDLWRDWWEIDPRGPWQFPVVGDVKKVYDVRGCAAICRTRKAIPNVVSDDLGRISVWAAAAKPFGVVKEASEDTGEDDGARDVTALAHFVTPCFTDVRLVPLDTVGGKDLATADAAWMDHVRKHLPDYMRNGPNALCDCYYCRQLLVWERATFRRAGAVWLRYHGDDCSRPTGPGSGHGGTPHGH